MINSLICWSESLQITLQVLKLLFQQISLSSGPLAGSSDGSGALPRLLGPSIQPEAPPLQSALRGAAGLRRHASWWQVLRSIHGRPHGASEDGTRRVSPDDEDAWGPGTWGGHFNGPPAAHQPKAAATAQTPVPAGRWHQTVQFLLSRKIMSVVLSGDETGGS